MSTRNINIGRDAQGNAFGDGSIVTNTNSFNHCVDPTEAAHGLAAFKSQLAELEAKLPEDKRAEASLLGKKLEESVLKKDPDSRAWYSISARGLLDAAKFVKDFSGDIGGTLLNLGKAVWPGFTL